MFYLCHFYYKQEYILNYFYFVKAIIEKKPLVIKSQNIIYITDKISRCINTITFCIV